MNNLFIIIPCFNEEKKLPVKEIIHFITQTGTKIIFVNDGSTDSTLKKLEIMQDIIPGSISIISNTKNFGKGNSIRAGVQLALQDKSCGYIGYFDADLSTPLEESVRLKRIAISENMGLIFGSRVALFGYHIKRRPLRHYLGRIFATSISLYLRIQIYDTQCGAKILNRDIATLVFKDHFLSRWLFDVEILNRIKINKGRLDGIVKEVPLHRWIEKGDSKLKLVDFINIPIDFIKIMFYYRK